MGRTRHPSSFRDPAGFVFVEKDEVFRQVNQMGSEDYELMMSSGLYDALITQGLMVAHSEVASPKPQGRGHKVIKPERIPFLSYPYEWSFTQLKDAALLTLRVQKLALKHGMILKDASAYNIQFIGKRPVLIDTLSFMRYESGNAWEGYRQFCEHFIAPLALASYTTLDVLKLLRTDLEGVSLHLAASLLPKRARFNAGLLSHLFIHNSAQQKYQNAASEKPGKPQTVRTLSPFALDGLIASLEQTIKKLRLPSHKTEWGDYYTFTNYSEAGFKEKRAQVGALLDRVTPKPTMVWDIGANNGEFSSLAVDRGAYTVAFDIDPLAVDRNYRSSDYAAAMLPLVQDVVNPSAATGFLGTERDSLVQRGPADVVMALALIHHLAIGRNLPFDRVAELLAAIGKNIIIEFVPKSDSKVQILLSSRRDVFDEYDAEHFEAAMAEYFTLVEAKPIKHTERTLYLFKRK